MILFQEASCINWCLFTCFPLRDSPVYCLQRRRCSLYWQFLTHITVLEFHGDHLVMITQWLSPVDIAGWHCKMTAVGNSRSNARFVRCKRWALAGDSRPWRRKETIEMWHILRWSLHVLHEPVRVLFLSQAQDMHIRWTGMCALNLNSGMFMAHFQM